MNRVITRARNTLYGYATGFIIILLLAILFFSPGSNFHRCFFQQHVRQQSLHLLNHQPPPRPSAQLTGLLSLSWSYVENIIPLCIFMPIVLLFHAPSYWSASPTSPLYPDTFSRYLSLSSSPILNDQYSAENQSLVTFCCISTLRR